MSLRPMQAQDIPFITNSWLKSYDESPFRFDVSETEYYALHHAVLEQIFKRAQVIVAVDTRPPALRKQRGDIMGYLCADAESPPYVLHFIYVKADHRREGVARALVDAWLGDDATAPVYYSHRTNAGEACAAHLFTVAEHNPYLPFLPWPQTLKARLR
jgi:GNAT superfamily N-acetyltransferase